MIDENLAVFCTCEHRTFLLHSGAIVTDLLTTILFATRRADRQGSTKAWR